jgi:hypothetical protein
MSGRTIRIFLAEGTPTGLRIAELGLSTIKALMVPRGSLPTFATREEASKTGAYVLVGSDPDSPGRMKIYIGEGDEVLSRVLTHDKDETKDFWDRVVVFVSKDQNLTKAHVRYLEARLVNLASEAKRSTIDNRNTPIGGTLPEADTAEMEEFIDQAKVLLGVLGVNVFDPSPPSMTTSSEESKSELLFRTTGDGYDAKCVLADGEFVVKKDSLAKFQGVPSLPASSKALREELMKSGVLLQENDHLRFTQDYAFRSASSAAQAVAGASVNGRNYWKLEDGRTLAQWQEEQIGPSSVNGQVTS